RSVADVEDLSGAIRARDRHAGVPPANFSIAPQSDYAFAPPTVPLALPSELLERRPDIVAAERTAAAANARIGVAEAAFFPTLDLTATGGFQHNTLANLFFAAEPRLDARPRARGHDL